MGFSSVTVEEFEASQGAFVDFMAEEMGLSASSITIVDVYIDDGNGRRLLAAGDLVVIFEVTADEGVSTAQFETQIEEALQEVEPVAVNTFAQENISSDAELAGEIAAGEVRESEIQDSSGCSCSGGCG